MGIKGWLSKNTYSLVGKKVAVTGSTGGIGMWLCRYLISLGAELILLNRSRAKTNEQIEELTQEYCGAILSYIPLDLSDFSSVKRATEELKSSDIDMIIHNAGAYSIPRCKCALDLDNVFMINFAAPYYMTRELLPMLRKRDGRVVAVGSIAHNYSRIDSQDLDFSTRGRASLVYGNAKRHLMYALSELFSKEDKASLSVVHPGITFTNITAHYPKLVFAIIKYPMKVIFTRPKKATLSVLRGVFEPTGKGEWIGPRAINVWGYPSKKPLKTANASEISEIFRRAEDVYERLESI